MADLNRALQLMKALDLEQLERQDQIEMQEVISILESLPPDQMTSEDEKQDALQALHEAEQMADVDATQEDGFVPHGEEAPPETEQPKGEAVEVEPDSSEVTVDSVMEEKLEEATKEALKDEPK